MAVEDEDVEDVEEDVEDEAVLLEATAGDNDKPSLRAITSGSSSS